jgi:hypothetical protein
MAEPGTAPSAPVAVSGCSGRPHRVPDRPWRRQAERLAACVRDLDAS